MNRKNLTAAVLAGLAGAAGIASTAQAVNLNPDGLGQVLVYPYYTAQGGNFTILSVVNTTELGKAVKVRFLEGTNSKEVLDFNLYMSPYDVWAAAVVDDGGVPSLTTSDTTCTVPTIEGQPDQTQEFFALAYAGGGTGSQFKPDGGPSDIGRAAEGHFEMIEMHSICTNASGNSFGSNFECDSKLFGTADEGAVEFYTNHVTDPSGKMQDEVYDKVTGAAYPYGRPRGCAVHSALWSAVNGTEQVWLAGATDGDNCTSAVGSPGAPCPFGLRDPVGGMFGGAAVINTANASMFAYDARAIDGFWRGGGTHAVPGNTAPSLNSGGNGEAWVFNNGKLHYFDFADGVDAVSAVFMHDTLMNEYNVEAGIKALSEWVVTFPTKSFYNSDPTIDSKGVQTAGDVYMPFTAAYKNGKACEILRAGPGSDGIWNREEETIPSSTVVDTPIFSPGETIPGQTPTFTLCYETNVIRFGEDPGDVPTEIFASTRDLNVDTSFPGFAVAFENGWASFDLANAENPNVPATEGLNRMLCDSFLNGNRRNNNCLFGLPVTGFWALQIEDGSSFAGDGLVAKFGGVFNHKYTRQVSGGYLD